jgi:hypothetical protein
MRTARMKARLPMIQSFIFLCIFEFVDHEVITSHQIHGANDGIYVGQVLLGGSVPRL